MTMNSFPFTTTSEQRVHVPEIAARMKAHGLPAPFIPDAVRMAEEYEGLYELMALWNEEEDEVYRGDIVADIQEELHCSSRLRSLTGLEGKGQRRIFQ